MFLSSCAGTDRPVVRLTDERRRTVHCTSARHMSIFVYIDLCVACLRARCTGELTVRTTAAVLNLCMYVLKTGHACLVPPSQRNSSSGRPYTTQRWGTRRPDLPTMTTSRARALEFSSTRSLALPEALHTQSPPAALLSTTTNPHCDTGNALYALALRNDRE